jgi:hypothetical protein
MQQLRRPQHSLFSQLTLEKTKLTAINYVKLRQRSVESTFGSSEGNHFQGNKQEEVIALGFRSVKNLNN